MANTPLIVGYGGGVNSCAVVVGLHARNLVPDLIVFADTGDEKPKTYAHLLIMEEWLAQVGFPPLVRVKKRSPHTGDTSLEVECLRRETMPSRAFGLSSCAHRWKIEPMDRYLNHWLPAQEAWARGERPVKAIGYDLDEDSRAQITEDAKLRYWYPLRDWGWTREQCVDEIKGVGLPVPPKSACYYCPSSTKTEVLQLAKDHPDLLARALAMENRALTSTRHTLLTVKGLGRRWAWATLIAASEVERASLAEAPVESCLACSDDGCPMPITEVA